MSARSMVYCSSTNPHRRPVVVVVDHTNTDPPLANMMDEQLAALYEGSVARLAARGRSVRLEMEKVG